MTASTKAEPEKNLDDAIGEMPVEWLACRAFGHAWRPQKPRRRAGWGVLLSLVCFSCKCRRDDTIDRLGTVSTRQYIRPDGYSLKGYGDDLPSRSRWRQIYMNTIGISDIKEESA